MRGIGEDIFYGLLLPQIYLGLVSAKIQHCKKETVPIKNLITRYMFEASKDIMSLLDDYGFLVPIPERWIKMGATFLLPVESSCKVEDSHEDGDEEEGGAVQAPEKKKEPFETNLNFVWCSSRDLPKKFYTNVPGVVKMFLFWMSRSKKINQHLSVKKGDINLLDAKGNLVDKSVDNNRVPIFKKRQWQLRISHNDEPDVHFTLPQAIHALLMTPDDGKCGFKLKNMLSDTGGFKEIEKGVAKMGDAKGWANIWFGSDASKRVENAETAPAVVAEAASTFFDEYKFVGNFAFSDAELKKIEDAKWKNVDEAIPVLDKKITQQMEKVVRLISSRESGRRIMDGQPGSFGPEFFKYENLGGLLIAQNLSLDFIRAISASCNYAQDLSQTLLGKQGATLSKQDVLECHKAIAGGGVPLEQIREHLAIFAGGVCNDTQNARRISYEQVLDSADKFKGNQLEAFEAFKMKAYNNQLRLQESVLSRVPKSQMIDWDAYENEGSAEREINMEEDTGTTTPPENLVPSGNQGVKDTTKEDQSEAKTSVTDNSQVKTSEATDPSSGPSFSWTWTGPDDHLGDEGMEKLRQLVKTEEDREQLIAACKDFYDPKNFREGLSQDDHDSMMDHRDAYLEVLRYHDIPGSSSVTPGVEDPGEDALPLPDDEGEDDRKMAAKPSPKKNEPKKGKGKNPIYKEKTTVTKKRKPKDQLSKAEEVKRRKQDQERMEAEEKLARG